MYSFLNASSQLFCKVVVMAIGVSCIYLGLSEYSSTMQVNAR